MNYYQLNRNDFILIGIKMWIKPWNTYLFIIVHVRVIKIFPNKKMSLEYELLIEHYSSFQINKSYIFP